MTILIMFLAAAIALTAAEPAQASRTPVVVELFTSEGCSSCPPADRLLQALDQRQPVAGVDVIVLSEHVDYWDQLGWRDPFSSAQFTSRQREYAETLRGDGVYTPQMVVNGQSGFVGNQSNRALQEIAKQAGRSFASVRLLQIRLDGPAIVATIAVSGMPAEVGKGPFDVIVAVTESGLHSRPGSGENQGSALSHTGVVRLFNRVGRATAGEGFQGESRIKLDASWHKDALHVIALVQDRRTHVIWGATREAVH